MVSLGHTDRISDLMPLIAKAADAGDVETVLDLTTVLRRWESEGTAPTVTSSTHGRTVGQTPERNGAGKTSKRESLEWADKTKIGYASLRGLRRRSRSMYSSRGGLTVGIAASRWRRGEPTCFLGLSENLPDSWDVVVLLCEVDGRVLDFAIPQLEVEELWPSFSRSNGQIKFHIQRGKGLGNYELCVPGRAPVDLQKYFGRQPEI